MTATMDSLAAPLAWAGAEDFAIDIDRMSAANGRRMAVQNLSMHVPAGSIYGLVGPSGSGKSTVARVLATLQLPSAGTVIVDGIDVLRHPARVRERIGYLPDVAGVYEGLTVSEYLDFYGAIYRISPRRRRQLADQILELFDLTSRRNDAMKSLSRGMKQQLGLARCLIHDPRVLVLDEPAAGMDPRMRLELRDILQELSRLGKTVLISSHLLSELSRICTHVGILRSGTLVAEGTAPDILGAISPNARIRIRLLDPADGETAVKVLEAHPGCGRVEIEDEATLQTWFDGTEPERAALHRTLVQQGVQVAEYAFQPLTLEEVFLQVTGSEART